MWDLSGIKLWLVSKRHPFQVRNTIVLNLTAMAWDVGPCLSRQSCAIASELISDLCSAPAKPPKYLSWLLQKFSASFPETLKTRTAGREAELAKLVGCFFFFFQCHATAILSNWWHWGHSFKNRGWSISSPKSPKSVCTSNRALFQAAFPFYLGSLKSLLEMQKHSDEHRRCFGNKALYSWDTAIITLVLLWNLTDTVNKG